MLLAGALPVFRLLATTASEPLQYLNKALLFRCHFARRNFRPVEHRILKFDETFQRSVSDSGFGEFHAALIGSPFTLTDSGLTSVSPRA